MRASWQADGEMRRAGGWNPTNGRCPACRRQQPGTGTMSLFFNTESLACAIISSNTLGGAE
ncbi:hypothetical protein F220043C3_41360 [Enterocloster asparagiformis]